MELWLIRHGETEQATLKNYDAQKKAPNPEAFLSADRWGVEFFRPSGLKNELTELSQEQLRILFSSLCSFRNYDYICCDFVASSSQKCFAFFELAARIVLIDDGKPISLFKNERLWSAYTLIRKEFADEAIIKLTNKWKDQDEFCIPDKSDIYIEYDPDSFRFTGTGIEVEMDRSFGLGVKKLAEKIRRKI